MCIEDLQGFLFKALSSQHLKFVLMNFAFRIKNYSYMNLFEYWYISTLLHSNSLITISIQIQEMSQNLKDFKLID